jgi:hypothetical protein
LLSSDEFEGTGVANAPQPSIDKRLLEQELHVENTALLCLHIRSYNSKKPAADFAVHLEEDHNHGGKSSLYGSFFRAYADRKLGN